MNFDPVPDSGNLHSLGYNADTQELHARFGCKGCKKTGIVAGRGSEGEPDGQECPACKGTGYASAYAYSGIPPETYAKVRGAPSVGSALHQHVVKNVQGVKL